jgi:hypothetical protein
VHSLRPGFALLTTLTTRPPSLVSLCSLATLCAAPNRIHDLPIDSCEPPDAETPLARARLVDLSHPQTELPHRGSKWHALATAQARSSCSTKGLTRSSPGRAVAALPASLTARALAARPAGALRRLDEGKVTAVEHQVVSALLRPVAERQEGVEMNDRTDHSSSCSSSDVPDAPAMAACASSNVAYSTSA